MFVINQHTRAGQREMALGGRWDIFLYFPLWRQKSYSIINIREGKIRRLKLPALTRNSPVCVAAAGRFVPQQRRASSVTETQKLINVMGRALSLFKFSSPWSPPSCHSANQPFSVSRRRRQVETWTCETDSTRPCSSEARMSISVTLSVNVKH